jgi:peptide/nickel transport system permease protein
MSASTMASASMAAADAVNDLRSPVRQGRLAFLWQALRMDKLALFAAVVLLAMILIAVFAPFIAPYDPAKQSLSLRNDPPMTRPAPDAFPYVLGADALGRDVLSRLIYGTRVSLAVGAASVLISGLVGATLGLVAGYYRGTADDIIMRAVDVWMGFPSLLLALIVLYVTGAGFWNVVLVLAVTRWMVYARVTRSLVLSYRENVFIEAARATGCTDREIITRHLLPNLLSPILVLATLETATIILIEASLSFLGLGLPLSVPSWGQMLAQGREYVTTAWWLVTFPGLAILITALALNLLASWARTVTDPAQRWRFARRMKPVNG